MLLQHGGDVWLRNAAGKTAAEEVHTRSEVRMCVCAYVLHKQALHHNSGGKGHAAVGCLLLWQMLP